MTVKGKHITLQLTLSFGYRIEPSSDINIMETELKNNCRKSSQIKNTRSSVE